LILPSLTNFNLTGSITCAAVCLKVVNDNQITAVDYPLDDRALKKSVISGTDSKALVPTILNRPEDDIRLALEMLVRAYDPCISCSAHLLQVSFTNDAFAGDGPHKS